MVQSNISSRSKKVAKNTLLLYFRMLVLMFIGLFTSRIVLKALGVDDYGTYNVVYSIIMMFNVLASSISGSVSRFLAFEIGSGDTDRLKKVFSGAVRIQVGLCILMVLLAETLGLWYFFNKVDISPDRMEAAMWVFQSSVVLLGIQLMSIPFNCAIIAHEDMKIFAWISLLEGFLKLSMALLLLLDWEDKLIIYAVLMAVVAFVIRITYAAYCRKNYDEVKNRAKTDAQTVKAMLSLGAWSFTAQGVGVFNTHGINLLANNFFGVAFNAARGVAGQIENITRQFVSNFLTALNPLITKTWAEENHEYCFELVRKGCKYSILVCLLFAVPFLFESDFILDLWLVEVPDSAAVFTSLAILCVLADMMSNSLSQLVIAKGKVGVYYLITSAVSALTFILSWMAFKMGHPAYVCYCISIVVFSLISLIRLFAVKILCGFPIKAFLTETALPTLAVCLGSVGLTWLPYHFMAESVLKSIICIATALVAVCLLSFFIALTAGERKYLTDKLFHRF